MTGDRLLDSKTIFWLERTERKGRLGSIEKKRAPVKIWFSLISLWTQRIRKIKSSSWATAVCHSAPYCFRIGIFNSVLNHLSESGEDIL